MTRIRTRTLHFTKEFVGGTLKGLTYEDKITVPASEAARHIASLHVAKETGLVHRGFGSPYVIIHAPAA
jgi:hypothetical protein